MNAALYTWGTGAAWGRDLGCLPTDQGVRHHTSLSILVGDGESQTHFLIDVGVPCVESMIDAVQDGNVPMPPPDAVFITHSHFDHHGDLMKLVFSRENGWIRNHSSWILTDADWRELCRDADLHDYHVEIDIAEDGRRYEL